MDNHLIALFASQHTHWKSELTLWLLGNDLALRKRCILRLGNSADADDAMQEIILKVIRAMDQFQGQSTLRTWIISIAENHCRSVLRVRHSRQMRTDVVYGLIHFETERRSSVDLVEHRESAEQVRTTLQRLSDQYRVILQLRFFEGLSIAQMASALELSLSAAKMRLYRAMKAFRQKHALTCS